MILQYSPSGSTSGVFSRRRSVLSDSPTLSARISSVIPCLRASLSASRSRRSGSYPPESAAGALIARGCALFRRTSRRGSFEPFLAGGRRRIFPRRFIMNRLGSISIARRICACSGSTLRACSSSSGAGYAKYIIVTSFRVFPRGCGMIISRGKPLWQGQSEPRKRGE